MNPLQVLKNYYLGKELKYLEFSKSVMQEYLILKKKSANVTDEQFDTGLPKYCNKIFRKKRIGNHRIYQTSKIVDIITKGREDESYVVADTYFVLEDGYQYLFLNDCEFVEISANVFMEKYLTLQ